MVTSPFRRRLAVALVLFVSLPVLSTDPVPAPGDLWEVVSEMSMEGFPMRMPPQTMKVCAAKQWTRPPGADNPERGCTSSDMEFNPDLNTVTWTSVCRDGTTGRGEIRRNGDEAYEGEIRYASEDGDVLIKLTGQRIGDCDKPQ